MPNGDWVPDKILERIEFLKKWKAGLADPNYRKDFKWDAAECDGVATRIDAALAAHDAYEAAKTPENRIAKDEAMEAAVKAVRKFANPGVRYNDRVPDTVRLHLGIPPADTTRTPAVPPESFPEGEGDTGIVRQVTIHFWDSVTKRRGKPPHVHGAEILWAILDHDPTSVAELVHSAFDTASPVTLPFDEGDRGKRLHFALRWATNTNQKGPLSQIYSCTIP